MRRPRGSLCLDVRPPVKTADRYEIRVDVTGQPFTSAIALERLRTMLAGFGTPFRTTWRFGFRAVNGTIAHAEIWDSVVPLMLLTRSYGPLYKAGYDAATIRFRYPILERVRQFYVRRASHMGVSVDVEADTFDRTYATVTAGSIIAFGGGKESRLLLGLLRELDRAPRISTGGRLEWPADLPSAERHHLLCGLTSERVVPALMSNAAHYYYGSGLAEVHASRPWHRYYDRASPEGQAELTDLLQSLGIDLTQHVPLCVLPANVAQKILAARYPDLYRHQRSVTPESPSEKNLDISLLKLYHDLPFAAHCSDSLFRRLLRKFVAARLWRPDEARVHRATHNREMMAIIWRRRDHRLLRDVRAEIPSDWDGAWIDGIHTYVNPDVDPSMLEIFREYARDYVPGPGDYRIPTPESV